MELRSNKTTRRTKFDDSLTTEASDFEETRRLEEDFSNCGIPNDICVKERPISSVRTIRPKITEIAS